MVRRPATCSATTSTVRDLRAPFLPAGFQSPMAKPRVTPEATIVHYGGASEKARADKLVRLFRAKRLLFERHCSPLSRWWCTRMLDLWVVTRLGGAMMGKLLGRGAAAWRSSRRR